MVHDATVLWTPDHVLTLALKLALTRILTLTLSSVLTITLLQPQTTPFSCSTPGVGASPEDEARVELQRSLRAWLELQADVNALIDSTTAPEKGVSVGHGLSQSCIRHDRWSMSNHRSLAQLRWSTRIELGNRLASKCLCVMQGCSKK